MQTTEAQHEGIQNLKLCGELGIEDALRLTTIETDKQYLDKNIINFISKTKRVGGKRTGSFYKTNSKEV